MGPNNKIGAKCLSNLHLKLNENGILENICEQIDVNSDDKEETNNVEKEEKDQEEELTDKEE